MPDRPDRITIDIETIATCDNPDFDAPSHWIPFAVAIGYQPEVGGEIETEVIVRRDATLAAEAELLHRSLDWIAARSAPGRELISYNGDSYDLPILRHRANSISDSKPRGNPDERLSLLLDTSNHIDLIEDMREAEGYWVSLDDALDMHDIDADEPTWGGTPVSGEDMLQMGVDIMAERRTPELRDVVERYAASDVRPLFQLRDELR